MSDEIPVLKGQPPSAEDQRLIKLFDDIEANQLEILDQSGKRIVELTGILMGILLGVTVLGPNFPPIFLQGNTPTKLLTLGALGLYLLAMLMGMRTVNPQQYKKFTYNLTRNREELDKMIAFKSNALWWAGAYFLVASILLGILLTIIILQA